MQNEITRRLAIAGGLASLATGCVVADHGHGPPPHAPAHGYRRKYRDDVVLVYDAGLGIYLVNGRPGHYYDGTYFYRPYGGIWQVSVSLEGPWRATGHDRLPPGLRRRGGPPDDPPGRGHGRS